MPLRTRFERGGAALPLRWGWWHVECFLNAWRREVPAADPWGESGHTFARSHHYCDPADGEVLQIKAGDTFTWSR